MDKVFLATMQPTFNEKVVLITGGSSGIGKALAIQLLQQGALVAVCARDAVKLEDLRKLNHANHLFLFSADVSREAECQGFVDAVLQHWGHIDMLINNAGISMRALFSEVDLDVLRRSMDINFWGTVYCTKFALPEIVKNKGIIVGISSIAGYKGLPCRTGYSASKFAMQGFLESLRIELLPDQVHVMWVSPGFVASNIRNTALNAKGGTQQDTPLDEGKLMSAETCASLILTAMLKRKRTLIMTLQGKLTVWMNKWFPGFVDRQVLNHFMNEADSPLKKKQ